MLENLKQLQERHLLVKFQWIPSHSRVQGNEKADNNAKASLNSDKIQPLKFTLSDMYNSVNVQS